MVSQYSRAIASRRSSRRPRVFRSFAEARAERVERLLTVEVAQLARKGQHVSEATRSNMRAAIVKALG